MNLLLTATQHPIREGILLVAKAVIGLFMEKTINYLKVTLLLCGGEIVEP